MDPEAVRNLLEQVKSGDIDIDAALSRLRDLPFENVDEFALIDNHRAIRRGFPETIFAQGKTAGQVLKIFQHMADNGSNVLATRVSQEQFEQMLPDLPKGTVYHSLSRVLYLQQIHTPLKEGIVVVTAGTSDIPVAEEAAITAELMGHSVERVFDVGVAGLHRVINKLPILNKANVVVVVAGMEGALASVVAGLVAVPVIAVPTSIGYGASFQGLAALLAMLNSCANGVSVVNIDNGFGAGTMAAMINRMIR